MDFDRGRSIVGRIVFLKKEREDLRLWTPPYGGVHRRMGQFDVELPHAISLCADRAYGCDAVGDAADAADAAAHLAASKQVRDDLTCLAAHGKRVVYLQTTDGDVRGPCGWRGVERRHPHGAQIVEQVASEILVLPASQKLL